MYSVQLQMIRIKDGNEEQEDPDVDIFNISQNVQDIVIHLEVDEVFSHNVYCIALVVLLL